MTPLVSIVTPSLNQGKYIEETIQSVLSQDYLNLEYFVVDGGSTDQTLDILREYNTQIKWTSELDEGQADAINKGIERSKGKIVTWLNSDDILLPGAVGRIVECFLEYPNAEVVYGKSHFIDADGKIVGKYPTEPFDYERLAVFNFICQPSAFFKREAFHAVGGLNLNLSYALDLDLWIRMAKKFSVKYLPEFLSCYRLHAASKTRDYAHALSFHKESLDTALRHYDWAPLNKVYGYCYHLVESKVPATFQRFRLGTVLLSMILSTVKYFQFNRQIRLRDIRALNLQNFKKLSIPWHALYMDN